MGGCVEPIIWEWAPPLNHRLNDFEKEEDENDGEDEAEAASAVVTETWTHAVSTEAEPDPSCHSTTEMAAIM